MLNEKTIIRDASTVEGKAKDPNKISVQEAMGMNRRQRRILGKINGGIKIPGSLKPYIRPKQDVY